MVLESSPIEVLDHGYVKKIPEGCWGSDQIIIESARMSTNKGFQGWETDARLLRFLWEHHHLTPFEMAGLTVEIQAPIFVFREWHRHRTQSYNELSARYTELPDLSYIPSLERLMAGKQSSKNKQGSEEGFTETEAIWIRDEMETATRASRMSYNFMLERGVSREIARLVIPVNQYSRMRASANLRNWLGFLDLRLASGAQWEIRQYAQAVGQIIAEQFPRTWELFSEGRHNDEPNPS